MPDADHMRSRLSVLRPPAPSEAARDRALHRATLALAAAARVGPAPAVSAPRRNLSLLIASAAALALAFALGLGSARFTNKPASESAPPPLAHLSPPAPAADALRLLAEVQQLFPHRLNAVIDRDGALQLDLAPADAALAADQPLLVEFTHAGHSVRVLGFSGRAVEVLLDGHPVRLTPLLTGRGSVLLAGDDFAWSPGLPSPAALAGWQIEARPLAQSPAL
jgi:hypothetical protein